DLATLSSLLLPAHPVHAPRATMIPDLDTIAAPIPVAAVDAITQQMEHVLGDRADHAPVSLLVKHWGVDAVSAAIASFGVSPFITIVDRAVAENASGKRTLNEALKALSTSMVQNPIQFVRSREFAWIFGLYAATYATANSIQTYHEWNETDGHAVKLAGTTLVNMTAVIAKDRAFARMFGVIKPAPFPLASMGLFAVRDSLTVASCFHAPAIVAKHLEKLGVSDQTGLSVAQITTPVCVQLLSTPLHLLGLDLYNHRQSDWTTRLNFIRREYAKSSLMRVARVGPAFGIGGIGNNACRAHLRASSDEESSESFDVSQSDVDSDLSSSSSSDDDDARGRGRGRGPEEDDVSDDDLAFLDTEDDGDARERRRGSLKVHHAAVIDVDREKPSPSKRRVAIMSRDSLGVIALLIPITGISTMVLTEVLACTHHFDCSKEYPTLSYAATFKPEGYAFTIGMCSTALFILATILLFFWFLCLRLPMTTDAVAKWIARGCLVAGVTSAVSLFGLAVMDMRTHHDAHINFTVVFFVCAWITMIFVQLARLKLLRTDEGGVKFNPPCPPRGSLASMFQGCKRINILTAYRMGRFFLYSGVASTMMFGLLYMCVNGFWPNPIGFTAVQEAFFEAFAIVCQLLFMGTLSCELSLLNRTVEHRDYILLERWPVASALIWPGPTIVDDKGEDRHFYEPCVHGHLESACSTHIGRRPASSLSDPSQMEEVLVDRADHASISLLVKHWGVDAVSAAIASFGVSPFITIVDRAVAENASGKRTLREALKALSTSMVQNPIQFVRSREFAWIFGLYAATYVTANGIQTYHEWNETDGHAVKLAGTTLVNMTAVIAKDRAFARMFGVIKPAPFPLASMGLFAVRDSLTVASCFHAPGIVAKHLENLGVSERTSMTVAQIATPVSVQLLSTPLHLLGLDLYNHRVADWQTRLQFIRREYVKSSLMRVARVGPAFGIGGIGNNSCRAHLREYVG
ncbi:TPA: hypothetical protein N0F65_006404, partial [Lagenidium giganteum]